MTNAELLSLNGKILCGEAGAPLVVEEIVVGDGLAKDGEGGFKQEIKLVITGVGTLVDPSNPDKGSDPLPNGEKLIGGPRVEVEKEDKQGFFKSLNEHFKLSKPLVDQEDEWVRLFEGTEDSVYDEIVGQEVYIKLDVKEPKDPKYPANVNFYLTKLRKFEKAGKDKAEELKAKIAAKKAKLEADSTF